MLEGPNGRGYELTWAESGVSLRAEVTEVAAGLRVFTVNGVDIAAPYPADLPRPAASGIVMAPWPNRVADGRWTLNDKIQQLDITEVANGNAIHGLLRFTPYRVAARTAESITLTATVYPQHGYPFLVDTEVEYRLSEYGLDVTHRLTNRSDSPAPLGVGAHPYFTIGGASAEDLTLTISCDTVWEANERMIPTRTVPVSGDLDLREGRRLSELSLDHGFTDARMSGGLSEHTLEDDAGRRVVVWAETRMGHWQVYRPAAYPGDIPVVAIEPMSAPADALNLDIDIEWVDPGDTWEVRWGVRGEGFPAE